MKNEITVDLIFTELIKNRISILKILFLSILIFLCYFVVSPRVYNSEVVILPIELSGGNISSLLEATGLGGMIGASAANANGIFVALNSRTLSENVAEKLKLYPILSHKATLEVSGIDKEKALKYLRNKIMRYYVGKSGSIVISISTGNPNLSFMIANAYIEELSLFLNASSINSNFVIIDKATIPLRPIEPSLIFTIFMATIFFLASSMILIAFRVYSNS